MGNDRLVWPGRFARNDELPGEPHATGRELTVVGFLRRALQLILDFSDSLGETTSDGLVLSTSPDPPKTRWIEVMQRGVLATLAAFTNPLPRPRPADMLWS
jgi:hypothetical protein